MKPVILLVDDDPDLVKIFSEVLALQMPSYNPQKASSYASAIAVIDSLNDQPGSLALVIADHQLGDATGLDLLHEVRSQHPKVPLILHTGRASVEIEQRARAAGVSILRKPAPIRHWLATVRAAISSLPATAPPSHPN